MPQDPDKWYCRGFGYICLAFMMLLILMPNKYLSISHRKQCYAPSYMILATSLVDFEYQTCGIFEGLESPQDVESSDTTTFVACSGLGGTINKLVLLKLMVMVREISVIFDTGATYVTHDIPKR